MQEKLKSWLGNDQVFYGLLLILVGLGSFALGRLSLSPELPGPTAAVDFLTASALPALDSEEVKPDSGQLVDIKTEVQESGKSVEAVVASKSGTKYHLPSCTGAKQIKPDNLITFASQEEAKSAGYTPAANCPGLQ